MTDAHQLLPPMAAAVLHAGSPQSNLMRFGKEHKPAAAIAAAGEPTKQTLAVSTAIYDGVAVLYNEAEVNAMLVVDLPNRPTMGNLNRILKGRGLLVGTDYLAYRAKFDVDGNKYPVKDRPLVIEKLSATEMKVSANKHNYGVAMATMAKERGEASPSLTHARKLGEKGRRGELAEERIAEAEAEAEAGVGPVLDILKQAVTPKPLLPVAADLEQEELDRINSLELPVLEVGEDAR